MKNYIKKKWIGIEKKWKILENIDDLRKIVNLTPNSNGQTLNSFY